MVGYTDPFYHRVRRHILSPPLNKCNSGSTEHRHSTIQNSPGQEGPLLHLFRGGDSTIGSIAERAFKPFELIIHARWGSEP